MRPEHLSLLQALAGTRRQATDPRLEALQALSGVGHGAAQLPAGQEAAPAPVDPVVALQHAYAEYLKQSGRQQDPLGARVGQKSFPGIGGPLSNDPIKLLTAGREITHGANAGQMAQTYDLGNGKVANVYYRNGKRQVRVYTP